MSNLLSLGPVELLFVPMLLVIPAVIVFGIIKLAQLATKK